MRIVGPGRRRLCQAATCRVTIDQISSVRAAIERILGGLDSGRGARCSARSLMSGSSWSETVLEFGGGVGNRVGGGYSGWIGEQEPLILVRGFPESSAKSATIWSCTVAPEGASTVA